MEMRTIREVVASQVAYLHRSLLVGSLSEHSRHHSPSTLLVISEKVSRDIFIYTWV